MKHLASITLGICALLAGGSATRAQITGGEAGKLGLPSAADAVAAPQWLPGFGAPDMDNQVTATIAFDDGSGPALFAAGRFTTAGGVTVARIARLQGSNWSPLGSGVNNEVHALAVFDDGGGPALYAGGNFSLAGGVPASSIAKWDGSAWSALGTGLGGTLPIGCTALAVFDDGGGEALYAGGFFTTAGGAPANRIAKWDGATWTALGTGINNVVRALHVFDDGGGPDLYAGGEFSTAGGVTTWGLARWNGAAWSAVSNGGSPGLAANGVVPGWVRAMATFDDGLPGGAKLFVTGSFNSAGPTIANGVARWNGSAWAGVGSGIAGPGHALVVHDDGLGGGDALYVGGDFITAGGAPAKYTAKWNGAAWSAQGAGMNNLVRTLAVYDDGSGDGDALYAGGDFVTASGATVNRFARWDGVTWAGVGQGLNGQVLALAEFDDGSGPALYAGGTFTAASGVPMNRIAKWDGGAWSPLGTGMTAANSLVQAFAVFDDGSGPALYVGGDFLSAGGVPASRIAKWDGSTWSALGAGVNDQVRTLAVFDDGSGPALFAGGWFTTAGGAPALRIAKWDGSAWSPLGTGANGWVYALTVFDDGGGSGPALYAAGGFTTAGPAAALRVAKWDGANWSVLGNGTNNWVYALTVHDDGLGGGPALYAGGNFTSAGTGPAVRMARWNGAAWSALGSGMDIDVRSLAVFDDGTGSGGQLYAGGAMLTAGGVPANRIAKWNGAAWSPLTTGMNNVVDALAVHDDGSGGGPALYAGGNFTTSGGLGAGRLAQWGSLPRPSAWSDQGSALAGTAGDPVFTGTGTLLPASLNVLDLVNAAPSAPAALFVALSGTGVPFKGGTLLPFPFQFLLGATTTPAGGALLPFLLPPGVPPGTELWMQWAIQDAGAPFGTALSNATRGLVP